MMRTIHRLLPLLLAALALPATAGEPVADTFRQGLREGAEHEWVLRLKHDLEIVDVVQRREDIGAEVSRGVRGFIQNEAVYAVRDLVLADDDGHPTRIRRRYRNCTGVGKATIDQPGSRGRLELQFFTPLRGAQVIFTWVPEENDYGRHYEGVDGPEIHLAGLQADMGLAGTLTTEPVEVGSAWDLDLDQAVMLLAPGGNLQIWPKELGNIFHRNVYMGVGGNNAELLDGEVTGFARATYQGRREVDGRSLGVVAFELDVSSLADKTLRYQRAMPREERANPTILERAYMSFRVQGSGELLWDFEAGHARKYTFTGQQHVNGTVAKTSGLLVQEGGFPVTEEMQLQGDMSLELEYVVPQD